MSRRRRSESSPCWFRRIRSGKDDSRIAALQRLLIHSSFVSAQACLRKTCAPIEVGDRDHRRCVAFPSIRQLLSCRKFERVYCYCVPRNATKRALVALKRRGARASGSGQARSLLLAEFTLPLAPCDPAVRGSVNSARETSLLGLSRYARARAFSKPRAAEFRGVRGTQ